MNTIQRRRWEALQADRQAVDAAAAWLRQTAWRESYSGLADKSRAFALATFLEAVAVQLDRIPDGLRVEAVRASQWLAGGSATGTGDPPTPRAHREVQGSKPDGSGCDLRQAASRCTGTACSETVTSRPAARRRATMQTVRQTTSTAKPKAVSAPMAASIQSAVTVDFSHGSCRRYKLTCQASWALCCSSGSRGTGEPSSLAAAARRSTSGSFTLSDRCRERSADRGRTRGSQEWPAHTCSAGHPPAAQARSLTAPNGGGACRDLRSPRVEHGNHRRYRRGVTLTPCIGGACVLASHAHTAAGVGSECLTRPARCLPWPESGAT
jgi:hypothetical protein